MTSPIHVLLMGVNFPPETTGIAPYTGRSAAGLASRGHKVQVLTAHPHYPEWKVGNGYGQWTRDETIGGVSVRRQRHYIPRVPSLSRRAISELSLGVRQAFTRWGRPDVIVAVSPALLTSALVRLRTLILRDRTPFVLWVQDLYGIGLAETGARRGVAARFVGLVEFWLLRSADHVIVIHERFASKIAEDFGLADDRLTVIRNWTHVETAPGSDAAAVRARLGWAPDETVVLHAGNMGVKQGLSLAVAAARRAEEKNLRMRFVFLGDGAQRDELEREAAGLAAVEFLGSVPESEFSGTLEAADVLLVHELPGVSEMAVPSKLTSYFNSGRPVVAATDVAGITASEVRAAQGGLVVASGDIEGLLEAVSLLASDKELADRLGQNGISYRRQVLDETVALEALERVLVASISGSPRGA
ncbi:glycosyltransferase [Microcella alkalica]|uniref:glycosyltransferase n=1 Tax=Microcella alkalica TaxID=355930 RepID=UPI00145D2E78|nr:glycosyltransferase [Microcella alkalica]